MGRHHQIDCGLGRRPSRVHSSHAGDGNNRPIDWQEFANGDSTVNTSNTVLKEGDLPVDTPQLIEPTGLTRDRHACISSATSGRLSTRKRGMLFVRDLLPLDPPPPPLVHPHLTQTLRPRQL